MKTGFFQTNFFSPDYLKLLALSGLLNIVPGEVGGRLPPPPLRSEERERFIPPDGLGSVGKKETLGPSLGE